MVSIALVVDIYYIYLVVTSKTGGTYPVFFSLKHA